MKLEATKRRHCELTANPLQTQIITNPNWLAATKTPFSQGSISSNNNNNSKGEQTSSQAAANRRHLWPPSARLKSTIAFEKLRRASAEGCADMLREASRRDCNLASRDHMDLTPTLLAAQCGQLDALRILVGRGGDPERVSADGSSALHLASARNHLNCVSFLVNFGVNMWALDNELHTAKDVAAIEQQWAVQEYLDQVMAKQSAVNTKQVQRLKEKALLAAEKRIKRMRKDQMKAIKQVERDERILAKLSSGGRLLKSAQSIGDIKLVGRVEPGGPGEPRHRTMAAHLNASLSSGSCASSSFSSASSASATGAAAARNSSNLSKQLQTQRAKLKAHHQSMTDLFNLRDTRRQPVGLEREPDGSACSSSFSSTSGYLSSSSAKSLIKAMVARASGGHQKPPGTPVVRECRKLEPATFELPAHELDRGALAARNAEFPRQASAGPKYSDLVAIRQLELKAKQSLCGAVSGGAAAADNPKRGRPACNERLQSEQQPAGNSASRFKGLVGGVSRKVQLKRLLFQPQRQRLAPGANCDRQQANMGAANDERRPPAEPPGSLSRAISEPDLSQAVWSDARARELLDNVCELDAVDLDESNEYSRACEQQAPGQSGGEPDPAASATIPPPPPPPPPPPTLSSCRRVEPGAQQHQCLLTKCLSQLKLQRERALDRQEAGPPSDGEPQPTAKPTWQPQHALATPLKQVQFDNSDELIRHQLSAREFPLRPSLIKQKQLSARSAPEPPATNPDLQNRRRPTPVLSVDSIGSVGSLVQRNSTSNSSSSSPSSCANSAASFACKPARDSSGGSPTGDENNNNTSSSGGGVDGSSNCSAATIDHKLEEFLGRNGLLELSQVLHREQIDLEALVLLDEQDLRSLGILLGPRRKLLKAIEQRCKSLLERNRSAASGASGQCHRRARSPSPPLVIDTKF